MINKEQLKAEAAALGLELTEKQLSQFDTYAELLIETNKQFNLTAIKNPDEIVTKHFVDSLTVFAVADFPQNASVIDIGTGAGFPSVPMLIYRPDLRLTAVDSTGKKLDFVRMALETLGLEADVIHTRAEELGKGDGRERFDFAVSRAVAALNVLCEYCLPFVKIGGTFVAMKGSKAEEELKISRTAIRTLGGKFVDNKTITLNDDQPRGLVIISKANPTPATYPRVSAQISKKPL